MIVHGIPGNITLHEGTSFGGLRGDHRGLPRRRRLHRGGGDISDEAKRLIEVTERSLWAGSTN